MTSLAAKDFDLELSRLVYMATRDAWMDDAAHQYWKRVAWAEAKDKASLDPVIYGRLPQAVALAMAPRFQSQPPHHQEAITRDCASELLTDEEIL